MRKLSVKEYAKKIGKSTQAVYKQIKEGKLVVEPATEHTIIIEDETDSAVHAD